MFFSYKRYYSLINLPGTIYVSIQKDNNSDSNYELTYLGEVVELKIAEDRHDFHLTNIREKTLKKAELKSLFVLFGKSLTTAEGKLISKDFKVSKINEKTSNSKYLLTINLE